MLKVRLGVDEVVVTLMLNTIVLYFTSYLVNQVIRDTTAYGAVSQMVPEGIWLPSLPGVPNATSGILAAVVLALLSWLILFRTKWGAELRRRHQFTLRRSHRHSGGSALPTPCCWRVALPGSPGRSTCSVSVTASSRIFHPTTASSR